jgi:hypothetical protein
MLSMFALAAASVLSASAPDLHAQPVCKDAPPTLVTEGKAGRVQKLNELPNANHYLTVIRKEGGCSKPVIVRYDIGSSPTRR